MDKPNDNSICLYRIIAGATPKLTISANESSSLPMSEYDFKARAVKPSKKSNVIAAIISHEAIARFPLMAKIIAVKPEARFRQVIVLGMCLFIIWLLEADKSTIFCHYSRR